MEIRSINEFSSINENVIEGYAVVFNRESEILYDRQNKRFFIETIAREAINQDLIERSDIKMLINHNRERMLARSRYGKGSLQLEIDDYGLKFRFEIPDTADGQFIKEMVRRGDFSGCSFAFTDGEDIDLTFNRERNIVMRTVKSINQLYDCSIVADPAYQDTEVSIRSIEELTKTDTEETQTEIQVKDETWKDELNKFRQRIDI